jgi:hypothetical protein
MNERIRELAEQAGITTNLDTDYFEKDINKWVDYYSEKFARLIVRECADLFEIEWGDEKLTGNDVGYVLKKHFGVEYASETY